MKNFLIKFKNNDYTNIIFINTIIWLIRITLIISIFLLKQIKTLYINFV